MLFLQNKYASIVRTLCCSKSSRLHARLNLKNAVSVCKSGLNEWHLHYIFSYCPDRLAQRESQAVVSPLRRGYCWIAGWLQAGVSVSDEEVTFQLCEQQASEYRMLQ